MRRGGLYLATFMESLAVVLLERGVYFYCSDALGFSASANLLMGLVMGITYMVGALGSHRLSVALGERRVVLLTLALHLVLALVVMVWPSRAMMYVLYPAIGLLSGLFWPVIESYVTAGKASRDMLKSVGRFCIAWSVSVPIAMAIAGPLIDSGWAESLFLLTAVCHLAAAGLMWTQPARPKHVPEDHPELPDAARVQRYSALLTASRWSMLCGYALLFLLAPLLPEIFTERLALSTRVATPLVSLMDWMRVAAFAALMWLTFWYGRAWPILLGVLLMPFGFAMILFGQNLPVALMGELCFGLTTGLVYYAALYYGLAIKNAAVEAGGAHEALIGGGFALGPAAGLLGMHLSSVMDNAVLGMAIGSFPIVLLGVVGGCVPLTRLRSLKTSSTTSVVTR